MVDMTTWRYYFSSTRIALRVISHLIIFVLVGVPYGNVFPLLAVLNTPQDISFLELAHWYWYTTKSDLAGELFSPIFHKWFSHMEASTNTIYTSVHSLVKAKT